jgi:hypothetical protein
MENDQKLGLYEVYGDTKEDIVENIPQNTEDSGKKPTLEEEIPLNVENSQQTEESVQTTQPLNWEEFMHPEFPWNNKKMWINNPKAVQYWLNTKGGTPRDLARIKREEENVKTY